MKAQQIIQTIVAALLVALLMWMVQSCRTPKETLDHQLNIKDSTVYHHVYDTTHVTVIDSMSYNASEETESKNQTTINFAEGGGTYNAATGEATNVATISQQSSSKGKSDTNILYTSRIDSLQSRCDSLTQVALSLQQSQHQKIEPPDEPKRSGWDRFCTWWVIISWVIILVLLLWWVADYIPVLKPYKQIIKTFFAGFRLFKS